MAGHSQYKNIMHRKGAQDAKKAKQFTKIVKEIVVAAKNGIPDPNMNPRLKSAIVAARAANMPKDKIEGAIKKATGAGDTESYEEIRYEGYGPGGVAIMVEALTDNRNRTAPEIRSAFTKYGGNLGETGSVAFSFSKVGIIEYAAKAASADAMLEAAIEAGADSCDSSEFGHEIVTTPEAFSAARDFLIAKFGDPAEAKLTWKPVSTIAVNEDQARSLMKLIDVLEDNDDVQNVVANYEMSEEVMRKLSA